MWYYYLRVSLIIDNYGRIELVKSTFNDPITACFLFYHHKHCDPHFSITMKFKNYSRIAGKKKKKNPNSRQRSAQYQLTWHVSMGFSPDLSRSATCLGIIWYNSSSVRFISSSSFRIDSSSFFDFNCSWSSASFNSTDCCVPANIRSLRCNGNKTSIASDRVLVMLYNIVQSRPDQRNTESRTPVADPVADVISSESPRSNVGDRNVFTRGSYTKLYVAKLVVQYG